MTSAALTRSRRPRRDPYTPRPPLPVSLAATTETERLLRPYMGREIVGRELDGPLPVATSAAGWQEEPHPSEILATRSEWRQKLGELYTEMPRKDTELSGIIRKRKRAVLSLPRTVDPADSSTEAGEAAALCRYGLSQVKLFHQILGSLLDAPFHGIRMVEVVWERFARGPWAGAWLPVNLVDRPMHRFAFERGSHRLHIRQPRGRDPIPAPPYKLLTLRSGTRDTPWGYPELDDVYWLWYVARLVRKYGVVYLEKWAHPTGRVSYPHSRDEKANKEQIAEALALIEAIQVDQGIAVPNGLDVDLLESTRNGSVSYEQFLGSVRAAYALFLLGEVDTSGLGAQPGSYAKSSVSNDVRLETVKQDAHLVESHLTEDLLRWIVEINFGEAALPLAPRYHIHAVDADDRQRRMEGIGKAREWGLEVPRSYAYMTAQVPEPIEGEDVLEPPAPAPPAGGGGLFPFAAGGGPENPPMADARNGRAGSTTRPVHLADGEDHDDLDDPETAERAEAQARELDEAAPALLRPTLDYYQAHRQAVLAAWDEGAAGDTLSRAVQRLGALPRVRAQSLAASAIHGAGLALWQLREEDEAAAELAGAPASQLALPLAAQLAAPPTSDYSRADTPEAAIEYWARLLQIDKSLFQQLDDQTRRLAFTVAGVGDAALLTDLHRLVEESIAEGVERSVFVERMDSLYERHGVTPTSRWHAELVHDNMVRQAHGATHHRQTVLNPAAHRVAPYLRWRTLDDGRVRQRRNHNHAVMNMYIAAVDHPIWRTWGTPAGHKCRCRREVINVAAARRMGLTGSEPMGPWPTDPVTGGRAMPDPGFRAASDLSQPLTASADRAGQALDSASGDLGRALETLFGVLSLFEILGGA